MSKKALVDVLAKKNGLSVKDAGAAIDRIVETISKELKKNQRFSIPGFGTFSVSKRAARKGRNPRTGEAIKIKASKSVRFKAGTALKGAL
jgi:DNA-binding protein HU-beta